MKLIDQSFRQKALDCQKSFVVRAPAGSGKTELLIQRYLNSLLHVENPEECLILTFTNKAVKELQERLMQMISGDRVARPETQDLINKVLCYEKDKSWNLISNPHRFHIMTIDAYFRKLYERFVPQGIGLMPTLTDDPVDLNQKIAQEFIHEYLIKDPCPDLLSLVEDLNHNFNHLSDLFASLLSCRENWLPIIYQEELSTEAITSLFYTELQVLNHAISGRERQVLDILQFIIQYKVEIIQPITNIGLQEWMIFADVLLTQRQQWRKTFRTEQGIVPEKDLHPWHSKSDRQNILTGLHDLVTCLSTFPSVLKILSLFQLWPGIIKDEYRDLKIISVLKKFVAFSIIYKEKNYLIDFADITSTLLAFLNQEEGQTAFLAYIEAKLTHLFIDEVQDLSLAQYAIFQSLIQTMNYQPKSFFVVGDPQQAIYHFRGAEVGVFRRFEEAIYPGIEKLNISLQANFRSSPTLVDFVNKWSELTFGGDSLPLLGLDKALMSHASKDYEGQIVFNQYSSREQEAWQVAQFIKNYQITHSDHTVAILGRDRKSLKPIQKMLLRLGIPIQSNDLSRMIDKSEILDILALVKVIIEPEKKEYWLNLLSSRFFHATYQDIYYCFRVEHESFFKFDINFSFSEKFKKTYLRFMKIIESFLPYRKRNYISSWLNNIIIALGYNRFLSNNELENIRLLMRMIDDYGWYKAIDWEKIERRCEQRTLIDPRHSSIQLLTIHKAKGLEFDCVILPNLSTRLPTSDRPLLSFISWDRYALWGVSPHDDELKNRFNFCHKVNKLHQQHEAERLLYVALTRAKKTLYLSCNQQSEDLRSFWNLLYPLAPEVKKHFDLELPAKLNQAIEKIPLHHDPINIDMNVISMNEDPLELQVITQDIEHSRIIGLMIHDILSILKKYPFNLTAFKPQLLISLWRKHGGSVDHYDLVKHEIGWLLLQIQKSEFLQKIYQKEIVEDYSEYALYYQAGDQVRKIVIDKLLKDSLGNYYLIEFKTVFYKAVSADQHNLYYKQVSNYLDKLRSYLKSPVEAFLYYLADSKVISIVNDEDIYL